MKNARVSTLDQWTRRLSAPRNGKYAALPKWLADAARKGELNTKRFVLVEHKPGIFRWEERDEP